jgi:tetratricopeptide (TPR) repeat protein
LFIGVLLYMSVGVGCGRDTASTVASSAPGETTAAVMVRTVDPCGIVLTPLTGESGLDNDVARLQQAVRQAKQPVPHLERLGWTFVAKARVSFDPGFYKLAEQVALCIASKAPSSPEALLLRGHVFHHLHRFRDAEELARQLVAQRGLSYDYGLLGDALMEQGKLTQAVAAYQEMMDQKPSPQAYSRAAHIRWLTGDLLGAIEMMQMATGAGGSRHDEAAAWAYVRLALYELQAGHLSEASGHVAAALARQSEYAPALLARGRLLLAQGKPTEAVAPLSRAAQLNPLPEYQWVLIEALRAAGRLEAAEVVEAQLMQRGAVDDGRTFALYLATVGRDLKTALRLAEAELNIRADVFTLDTLAWALRAVDRYQEARAFSARALAENTQDARLFYHAGVIAAAAGQREEAKRWVAKATVLQHTLLPSERAHLAKASAALSP